MHPGWIRTDGREDNPAPLSSYEAAGILKDLFAERREDFTGHRFITNEGIDYPFWIWYMKGQILCPSLPFWDAFLFSFTAFTDFFPITCTHCPFFLFIQNQTRKSYSTFAGKCRIGLCISSLFGFAKWIHPELMSWRQASVHQFRMNPPGSECVKFGDFGGLEPLNSPKLRFIMVRL